MNYGEEERGERDEGASDGGGGVPLMTREMLRDRRLHQLVWLHYVKSGREGGEHLQITGLIWYMAAGTNLRRRSEVDVMKGPLMGEEEEFQ